MAKAKKNIKPWERRSDLSETAVAFKNFVKYRDMCYIADPTNKDEIIKSTMHRSLRALSQKLGLGVTTLKMQSRKYKWVERAEQYDEFIEEKVREANELELIKMRKKHASVANSLIVKAMGRFLEIPTDEITVNDVVRLVELGVKLERKSRGELFRNLNYEEQVARIEKLKAETLNESELSEGNVIIVDSIPAGIEVESIADTFDNKE